MARLWVFSVHFGQLFELEYTTELNILQAWVARDKQLQCPAPEQILLDSVGAVISKATLENRAHGMSPEDPIFLFHKRLLMDAKRKTLSLCIPEDAHGTCHVARMLSSGLSAAFRTVERSLARISQEHADFLEKLQRLAAFDATSRDIADSVMDALRQLPPEPLLDANASRAMSLGAVGAGVTGAAAAAAAAAAASSSGSVSSSVAASVAGSVAGVGVVLAGGQRQPLSEAFANNLERFKVLLHELNTDTRPSYTAEVKALHTTAAEITEACHVPPMLAHPDEMLLDAMVEELQTYATTIHDALQKVCRVTSQLRMFERRYPPRTLDEAVQISAFLEDGFRVPHALALVGREMERRREFKQHYDMICSAAYERITRLRGAEVAARRRFHSDHGRALERWMTVPGLDDYPHTCVARPRPFDDALPSDPPRLQGEFDSMVHSLRQRKPYERLQREWGCCRGEDSVAGSVSGAAVGPAGMGAGVTGGAGAGTGAGASGAAVLADMIWYVRNVQVQTEPDPRDTGRVGGSGPESSSSSSTITTSTATTVGVSAVSGGGSSGGAEASLREIVAGCEAQIKDLQEQVLLLNAECAMYKGHCATLDNERRILAERLRSVVQEMEAERKQLSDEVARLNAAAASASASSTAQRSISTSANTSTTTTTDPGALSSATAGGAELDARASLQEFVGSPPPVTFLASASASPPPPANLGSSSASAALGASSSSSSAGGGVGGSGSSGGAAVAATRTSSMGLDVGAAVAGTTAGSGAASEPLISFQNFKVGDLALFVPSPKHADWVAFNRGAPNRILPLLRLSAMGLQKEKFLLGTITTIEERVATDAKEFRLPPGTTFYVLDCEPFQVKKSGR